MRLALAAYTAALVLALLLIHFCAPHAHARDLGQWSDQSPRIRDWYRNLMQPDMLVQSCCGEADAYWADEFVAEGDHYVAIITDERPDAPLNRPHMDVGTRIPVPNHKLVANKGNPTGHGVIFVRQDGTVLCYVTPPGT